MMLPPYIRLFRCHFLLHYFADIFIFFAITLSPFSDYLMMPRLRFADIGLPPFSPFLHWLSLDAIDIAFRFRFFLTPRHAVVFHFFLHYATPDIDFRLIDAFFFSLIAAFMLLRLPRDCSSISPFLMRVRGEAKALYEGNRRWRGSGGR